VLDIRGGDVGDAAEGGEFGVYGGGEREGGDDEEGAGGEFDYGVILERCAREEIYIRIDVLIVVRPPILI
jgi:hypothetical protein